MKPCTQCVGEMHPVPHRPAWSGFSDYAAQCQTCNFVFNPHARSIDVLRFAYNTHWATHIAAQAAAKAGAIIAAELSKIRGFPCQKP